MSDQKQNDSQIVQTFFEETESGLFLFEPFAKSNIMFWHPWELSLDRNKIGKITLLGNEKHLDTLGRIITEKLLAQRQKQGIWTGFVPEDENKAYVSYRYHAQVKKEDIYTLLMFGLKDDLALCGIRLSDFMTLILKDQGTVLQNFYIVPTEEQKTMTAELLGNIPDEIVAP